MVATQDATKVYMKVEGNERRRKSGGFYETVSKYLNIQQVYIYSKAFLVQNTGSNVEKIIPTIAESVNTEVVVNDTFTERWQAIFKTSLEYLDSPRDNQVLKGLLAELTSIQFTTKLQGIHSRFPTTLAKSVLKPTQP